MVRLHPLGFGETSRRSAAEFRAREGGWLLDENTVSVRLPLEVCDPVKELALRFGTTRRRVVGLVAKRHCDEAAQFCGHEP